MKLNYKIALVVILLAALALPGTAFARSFHDDKVVAGDSITLESGEVLAGNLLVFGGNATIENGATIEGDLVLFGGTAVVDGLIEGNIVSFGGVVSLGDSAVVEEDLSTIGTVVNRAEGAQIQGNINTGNAGPFRFTIPGDNYLYTPQAPHVEVPILSTLGKIWWFFFMTFVWAGLAALVGLFLPNPIVRTARAVVEEPVISGGMGLLVFVVAPLLLVGIAITLILIPISLIGFLVLAAGWFLGRIALGYEVGRRIERMFNLDWPLPVAAGIGTFGLALVVDGVGELVPCVGWILPWLVGILGLGAVALTRFGTQAHPPSGLRIKPATSVPAFTPIPPAPVAPIVPVAPNPPAPVTGEDEQSEAQVFDYPPAATGEQSSGAQSDPIPPAPEETT